MIPVSQSQKLLEYYEKTGQTENAAKQRRSIKHSIKVIESRRAISRNQGQPYKKIIALNKTFTLSSLCQTILKLIALTAIIVLVGAVISGKAYF